MFILSAQFCLALRAPDDQVDQSADPVSEEDNADPDGLGVPLIGLFGYAIDERPDPEGQEEYEETHHHNN